VEISFLGKAVALLCRAQPLRDGLHVPSESNCRPPARRLVSTGGGGRLGAGSEVQEAGGPSTRKQPMPLFLKKVFLCSFILLFDLRTEEGRPMGQHSSLTHVQSLEVYAFSMHPALSTFRKDEAFSQVHSRQRDAIQSAGVIFVGVSALCF
jgi:hypothetical protein